MSTPSVIEDIEYLIRSPSPLNLPPPPNHEDFHLPLQIKGRLMRLDENDKLVPYVLRPSLSPEVNTITSPELDTVMPRHSERFIWKEGDGEGKKGDPNPKLYNEPPHKIVKEDKTTYPPKYVDLSSMWMYQVVRSPFINQEERYQRWPAVFPSKEPLRPNWFNKGLAPRMWSVTRDKWVYPVIFNRYQLHGDEGNSSFAIDQSKFMQTDGINTTHEILEGADCVVQEPPVSSGGLSSGGLQAAKSNDNTVPSESNNDNNTVPSDNSTSDGAGEEEIPAKRQKVSEVRVSAPKRGARKVKRKAPAKKSPVPTPSLPVPTPSSSTTKSAAIEAKAHPAPTPSTPKKSVKGKNKSNASIKVESSPSAQVIDSATGGRRFLIEESASPEKQDGVADLLATIAILREEKAQCERQLAQAQGKVVLLAASLNGMWRLLFEYGERMGEWTGFMRRWVGKADQETLDSLINNLKDNSKVDKALRKRANVIMDGITAYCPTLDRITLDEDKFNEWRDRSPEQYEKLFKKLDQPLDGKGKMGTIELA